MWIFIALLSPIFYGIANIFDSFLANKNFRNPFVMTFYASIFATIFIPILFIFYDFQLPQLYTLPIFAILGFINVSYLYPYYKGLQSDDTSTTVSFFGLGRIFIPLWAFIVIGEKLTLNQYIGIIIIIISSIILSMKGPIKSFKFSKALFYILLAAFIISFEGILLKYLFEGGISVGVGISIEMLFTALFTFLFLLHKKTRIEIKNSFPLFIQKIPLFLCEEGATFVAFFMGTYALNIAPVSLVKSIGALTPVFVLIYAKVFSKKFPNLFKEQEGVSINLKKILMFIAMFIGIIMILK